MAKVTAPPPPAKTANDKSYLDKYMKKKKMKKGEC